ncbi:hypothetical protein HELRODRAFT_169367 [Helobdella robusta]|uniref:Uncharacterized protein n=1 Tax=Helobdella robusta TaxID=6412 RepID=T1F1U9_HELRO|nr:hypothetical protein HELRODRAFT_169367 [Helobdella robusta]ESO08508.1 hypothetical protein HELRODRAFT_169367 [Helobdella robusta]
MHNQLKLADNPASDVDATSPTSEQQPLEPSNNATSTSSPSPTESIESTLPGVKLPKTSIQWALTILSDQQVKNCEPNCYQQKYQNLMITRKNANYQTGLNSYKNHQHPATQALHHATKYLQ